MSITYDSSSETIYIDDGSYGFIDIYNASISGGWGVVQKSSDDKWYSINAHLIFGSKSGTLLFRDTDKYVVVTVDNPKFYIKQNCDMELGLYNESTGKVSNGCRIESQDTSPPNYSFGSASYIGKAHFYGCYVIWNSFFGLYSGSNHTDPNIQFINSTFQCAGGRMEGSNSKIINTSFIDGATNGITLKAPFGEVNGLQTYNQQYGFYFYGVLSGDTIAKNVVIKNPKSQDIRFNTGTSSASLWLVNAIMDNWDISWAGDNEDARLYRQYTFDPIFQDKDGVIASGYSIEVKDVNDNVVIDDITNTDGKLTSGSRDLTYGTYKVVDGNTITKFSPYSVHITKTGVIDTTFTIEMDIPLIENKIIIDPANNAVSLQDIYNVVTDTNTKVTQCEIDLLETKLNAKDASLNTQQ